MAKKKTEKVMDWKDLVYSFVAHNRRLYGLVMLNAPANVVDAEKNVIQAVYEMMRDKCLSDAEYLETMEKDITPVPEPPTEDNNSLVRV